MKAKAYADRVTPPNKSGKWRIMSGFGHYRWLYVGQYTRTRMEDLTKEEWHAQKDSVSYRPGVTVEVN